MKKIIFFIATISLATLVMVNADKTFTVNNRIILKNLEALADNPDSNNHGSGLFFYEHLLGSPEKCTLYKNVSASGSISYSDEKLDMGAGYTSVKVEGIKELCPNEGKGCTVYSCRTTN